MTIVNNNKRELLRCALEALPHASERLTVSATVVDNASVDGSVAMVRSEFPEISVIAREVKHGSSANFNAGMLAAPPARYLGIMHEDARPLPGAFDRLIAFLDDHPRAGGLSPRIRFPNGELDTTAARFPTVLSETLGRLGPLAARFGPTGYAEELAQPFRVDYNSATCLIFRRRALEAAGLFDENFYIFYEEVDLARRLADQGWETWFVPSAEVVHEGGVTRRRTGVSPEVEARYRELTRYWPTSKYLYFRKHRGRAAEITLRLFDVATATLRILIGVASRDEESERERKRLYHVTTLRSALTAHRLVTAKQAQLVVNRSK